MATFKKSKFKEQYVDTESIDEENIDEENIDELINKDFGFIGSRSGTPSFDSEVSTNPRFSDSEDTDQDVDTWTDLHVANTRQRRKYPWGFGYAANGINTVRESKKILAKERMENLIEDLMSDKSDSRDFVKNRANQDINNNNIPDGTDVTNNSQALSAALDGAIEIINKQSVKGEALSVVLNHILTNVAIDSLSDKDVGTLSKLFKPVVTNEI